MNIETIQATWNRIEHSTLGSRAVIASELTQFITPYGNPILTVDDRGLRHLLLPVSDSLTIREDKTSSGIHVLENRWGMEGRTQRVVDIVCLKMHLSAVFDLVILDIFEALKDELHNPDVVAYNTLSRWRELLEREIVPKLKEKSIVGLFGELIFLRKLAEKDPRAILLWRGPFGERYDFYSGKTAVEVKTTRQRKGKNLTINGHDQLDEPQNGNLYLCRFQVEIASSANETLYTVLDDLKSLGCDLRSLESALNHIGFTYNSRDLYEEYAFNVVQDDLYKVDTNFPRITNSSFKNDKLPSGIVAIEYSIDLTSQPPFPISNLERETLLEQLIGEIT